MTVISIWLYAFLYTGIFSNNYNITTIDGQTVSLSQFQGKKILFVNTASNTADSVQYAELEQLYQLYKDSLVIIAFPSNDFGHEPAGNEAIAGFVETHYHAHFLLAAKTTVTGSGQDPVFQWLTHAGQNGLVSNGIKKDFYKFLVSGSGELVGVFDPGTSPLSQQVRIAITNN